MRIGEEPYKVTPNDRVLNDFVPLIDRQLIRPDCYAFRHHTRILSRVNVSVPDP